MLKINKIKKFSFVKYTTHGKIRVEIAKVVTLGVKHKIHSQKYFLIHFPTVQEQFLTTFVDKLQF